MTFSSSLTDEDLEDEKFSQNSDEPKRKRMIEENKQVKKRPKNKVNLGLPVGQAIEEVTDEEDYSPNSSSIQSSESSGKASSPKTKRDS